MPAAPSAVYRILFPPAVATAELRHPGDPDRLHPAEAAHLGRAVPSRAREFAAGRECARRALAQFGIDDFPLRVAADRQPIWPASVIGSITHTDGLCAAVAAQRGSSIAIGIDSEVIGAVGAGVAARICVPAELDWLSSLPQPQRTAAIMLIFSAKEAFYKCQYPLVGEWLGFQDLCVRAPAWCGAAAGRDPAAAGPADFLVEPMRPIAAALRARPPLGGRYLFHERYVSAGVLLQAAEAQ